MVRLRKLGSEFHHPDEIHVGAQMTMPYLQDMQAYQEYMDGDLSKLYDRMRGNVKTQNLTGSRYYTDTGNLGYLPLNLFQAVNRNLLAAVFESNPKMLDGDDDCQMLWEEEAPSMLREARKGVEWRAPKGNSVWALENRYPGVPTFVAWDPEYWIPLTDLVNRDLPLGDILWRPWWSGPRVLQHDFPDMITFYIAITEAQADLSDGRFGAMNEIRDFLWSGTLDSGVVAGTATLEEHRRTVPTEENKRILGVWSSGNSDSLFKSMEQIVYECILALSHSRTALSQFVRSILIAPRVVDLQNVNSLGQVELDLLNPQYNVPVDQIASGAGTAIGFLDPPGVEISASFREMYDLLLDAMAYAGNMPREQVGLGMQANESSLALSKLTQTFRTMVIDIRDDLSRILSEVFRLKYGKQVTIGWEDEPQTLTRDKDLRILAYYDKGLISATTAQKAANWPIEDVKPPAHLMMQPADPQEELENAGNR